jgi:hypothetical protein
MVIRSYFKKQGIAVPIKLGVNRKLGFSAHAWNISDRHQDQFKIIN